MNGGSASPALIQPVGFHIGISNEWLVTALSANVPDYLPAPAAASIGNTLTAMLAATTIHDIRNRMALLRDDDAIEHLFRCPLTSDGKEFDLSIYRKGDGFGIDAETSPGAAFDDATGIIEGMLARLHPGDDIERLCDAVAQQVRTVTGYGSASVHLGGDLIGRSARGGAQFPDVPPPNLRFTIIDREAAPIPVEVHGPGANAAIRSDLRAPGKTELKWLAACQARAAMVLPLSIGGAATGYVSCLHTTPRHVSLERRSIARLFTTIAALSIENLRLRSLDREV